MKTLPGRIKHIADDNGAFGNAHVNPPPLAVEKLPARLVDVDKKRPINLHLRHSGAAAAHV
jgi:hypothetical protein